MAKKRERQKRNVAERRRIKDEEQEIASDEEEQEAVGEEKGQAPTMAGVGLRNVNRKPDREDDRSGGSST